MAITHDQPLVTSIRLGRRGQMVLPAEIRRALDLEEGNELLLALWPDGRVILRPRPSNYTESLAGAGSAAWRGIDPIDYQRAERATWGE